MLAKGARRSQVSIAWLCLLCAALAGMALPAGALAAGPPVIQEEWSTEVSATGARLWAKIDPEENEMTYRFEYGESEAYGASIPIPDRHIAAGTSGVSVSASPQGLSAGRVYHYRVVAMASGETVYGADRTLTTQPGGGEFLLPDDRMWELVSPANKHGAGIQPINGEGGLIQAAAGGGAFTYIAEGPTENEPAGSTAIEFSQLFSTRRASGGWVSKDIATPHNAISFLNDSSLAEYKFFSSDLSQGLVEPEGETPLPPLEEGAEKTIYLRNDAMCGAQPEACFLPLVTRSNVQPGALIGPPEPGDYGVEFLGATPDLSHVVFQSSEALTAEAAQGSQNRYADTNLYEWSGGHLQLVNILPDGVPTTANNEPLFLGYNNKRIATAISDSGSRIVWEAEGGGERHLYMRDMATRETVQLDVPQPGVGPSTGGIGDSYSHFQGASTDGSRVFFTDEQRLTPGSNAEPAEPDLYVFELNGGGGPLSGKVTDLTGGTPGESAGVRGVILGTSKDGTYVYFVANGALAEHAVKGDCTPGGASGLCNLYMAHYNGSEWERPVLVAVLSNEDEKNWVNSTSPGGDEMPVTSRVSPNGEYVTFMSDRPLTGYDSADAVSGADDEEVYLYHASHGGLACASCDPSGARPDGVFDPGEGGDVAPLLVDRTYGAWGGRWLAGSIPGWTGRGESAAVYQSRYLSDNGRLFFDSPDGLVPADINGKENVYEYEPEGTGSCSSASGSAGEVFAPDAGGCVALISSGTSSEESAFLDASEGGGEVFFMTAARLSSEDVDNAFDVYVAHECTTQAPCLSAPVALPPCSTTESCRAASTPQPEVFAAPSSATFSGEGNVTPRLAVKKATQKPSAERRGRKRQLMRAVRRCERLSRGRSRAACVKRARKRYGSRGEHARSNVVMRRGK